MLLTLLAFVVALGVLIAVHEYGHYRVAVACGVRVLRFSVGFGATLVRWQPRGSSTEFVIGAFPLGGYVKMLDEREGPVPADQRHLAFNNQPLASRAAIVAAGPLINLLLAAALYCVVNWSGVEQPRAVLASPLQGSVAQRAGLSGGETVLAGGMDGDEVQALRSFDELRWLLARAALQRSDVRLVLADGSGAATREVVLRLGHIALPQDDAQALRSVGILAPMTRPVVGAVLPDAAAAAAGLRAGDLVLKVGAAAIVDGAQLRALIRASVRDGQGLAAPWRVQREGRQMEIDVRPEAVQEGAQWVGRIGAYIGAPPELVTVRYGLVEGLSAGVQRTWEVAALTLRMIGSMALGEASLKNLSGPLTIADYAGKSASQGLTQYLLFLALISVSLGVLNLLPLPVLDGGHLMYYLWEAATGKRIGEVWLERLQRAGIAVLALMMAVALYNDLVRLIG